MYPQWKCASLFIYFIYQKYIKNLRHVDLWQIRLIVKEHIRFGQQKLRAGCSKWPNVCKTPTIHCSFKVIPFSHGHARRQGSHTQPSQTLLSAFSIHCHPVVVSEREGSVASEWNQRRRACKRGMKWLFSMKKRRKTFISCHITIKRELSQTWH